MAEVQARGANPMQRGPAVHVEHSDREWPHSDLEIARLGRGERVLLVHGAAFPASLTWREQRPLAAQWALELINRRGYGLSPETDREDFEVDAHDVVTAVGAIDRVHLVGVSYGALSCLYAAGWCAEQVASLTLVEPPLAAVAAGHPAVRDFCRRIAALIDTFDGNDIRAWLVRIFGAIGVSFPLPAVLPDWLDKAARAMVAARSFIEAAPSLRDVATANVPTLVVTGDHNLAFEVMADATANELHARRVRIVGRGHAVQLVGAAFNAELAAHLTAHRATLGSA